ncbi:MAG: CoA transferase, partial [Rubrivivax sp.]|nr:CoA transferase [Rubrivivax sp.]
MSSTAAPRAAGPLAGLKVLELAGIGPGPLCAMLLADLGAQVLRLDRVEPSGLGITRPPRFDLLQRGKQQLKADLKTPAGLALALALADSADALIEGFRPGTMERLGLGPEVCLARNPRLVYGRITGFGQSGPLAQAAGHDLNYIALSGALHAIGRAGAAPTPPLNLLGDYAGGSLMLAFGIVSALLSARQTGRGQVVDAAMTEGVAALMTPFYGLLAAGLQNGPRGTNTLDSGAPFYEVYRCADGEYVSVAPIEAKFRRVLLDRLGDEAEGLADMTDPAQWPQARRQLETLFATRTRAQWCALLEGSDACFAPVLAPLEAPQHAQHAARGAFVEIDGITQPAPVPRFSAT